MVTAHGHEVIVRAFGSDSPIACRKRRNVPPVVCGDRVMLQKQPQGPGLITARLPRTSLLSRHALRGGARPVAANIDMVCVVFSPQPATSANLIDRYLATAEYQRLPAMLICNKSDVLAGESLREMRLRLDEYREIGYPCFRISAKSGDLGDNLQRLLGGAQSILVGQSGVGKSTLIKALTGSRTAVTGELMTSGLGRHTTSATALYKLPGGGAVIDSPGVRNFGTWHIPDEQLAAQFREFREFLPSCRFRDCRHVEEPGCGLKAAVDSGQVLARRYRSYRAFRTDL